MPNDHNLVGEIIDDEMQLTLVELCRVCQVTTRQVMEFVEEGIVEPLGRDPRHWRFRGVCVQRVRCASRLQHDLGVNRAGIALALDLLDEISRLRRRLG